MFRILRGEVLKGTHTADILIRALDGRDVELSISGAPVYNTAGDIIGGVLILRDVTERRRLERHTHNTLNALLEMAESLVLIEDEVDNEQPLNPLTAGELKQADHTRNDVAQRLAELTCSVLGCKRVSISAVEPETEILFPIAIVGLSPELEQQWWTEQQQRRASLRDNNAIEFVSRLHAHGALVFDMTQPPFRDQPNPYNVHTVLIVPMYIGSQLVGLLTLDHGGVPHEYTSDEIALAKAVARLGALVIERDRLLQERAEARANELALRESNRRMDTFLSMASHELRTPLTTIKGNVQLAQRQLHRLTSGKTNQPKKAHGEKNVEAQFIAPPTPPNRLVPLEKVEAVETLLARAEHQIQFLNRLVGDLLDVSRIQADTLELHRKPCDLVTLVRQTVEDQQQLFPNRTIRFLPPPPPNESIPVVADADCIGQVVSNYLSNALKYSAAVQPVEVRVQVEANAAHVAVSDQGQGVPPAEQAHIWERFYRIPGVEVQSGSHVGLGLGLHISRTIIERHGGQVGVQSIPGQGSTFWFTLPLTLIQNSEDGNH
jgi:signal transduction histidine kinase